MPTVLRWNGYRFFFYSNEGQEPPHIHVIKGGGEAKIWLEDLRTQYAHGFSPRDLRGILSKVEDERKMFMDAWKVYFEG